MTPQSKVWALILKSKWQTTKKCSGINNTLTIPKKNSNSITTKKLTKKPMDKKKKTTKSRNSFQSASIYLLRQGISAQSKRRQILYKSAVTLSFLKIIKTLGQSPTQMLQVIESRVRQEDISDLHLTLQHTEVLKENNESQTKATATTRCHFRAQRLRRVACQDMLQNPLPKTKKICLTPLMSYATQNFHSWQRRQLIDL